MKTLSFVITLVSVSIAWGAAATPLDDRIATFSDAGAVQTEAQATDLLKIGADEQRSAEALAAVQPWLVRNNLASPGALFYAGQAAERSGQWLAAVGYYQRLLQMSKLDKKFADPATDAMYQLLLNTLDDEAAAYLYMRKDGNRIRPFGRAKRFDRWFLDQAIARRDLVALSERLTVIAADNGSNPAAFDPDFEWFCTELEHFRKEEPAVYEAALKLAAAPRTPALYKARLNWVATVMPYNFKLDELRNANAPADPKLTDAPLATAAQLIKVAPDQGPMLVAKGWGTEYDGHHGTCALRFNIEGERKMAQLLAAVPRMSSDQRDDLLAYSLAHGRVKFDSAAVRKIVIQFPGMLNAFTVANVPLFDKTLTVEEAKQLAPQLARNPHPHASLVRAFANDERKYSAVVDQMMQAEAWRFKDVAAMSHGVWHSGMFDREGQEHDAPNTKYADFGARYQQLKKQIAKEARSQDRLAAFNTLRHDLISNAPTIPGALVLWDELFTNSSDADTIAMIKTLVADLSGEREYLLKRALGQAKFGEKRAGAMPWQAIPVNGNNQFRYHRSPVQQSAGELITHLQGMIQSQMQGGTISETIFGMWLHTVDPKDESAQALIEQLAGSPAYAKLNAAYHISASDSSHFGRVVMTASLKATDPHHLSRELLALPEDADAAQVEAALKAALDRVAKLPTPVAVIGLQKVATLPQWSDSVHKLVLSLFKENAPIGDYPTRQGYEPLIQRLCKELEEKQGWGQIESYASGLWQAAAATDDANHYRAAAALVSLSEVALKHDAVSSALALVRGGPSSRAGRDIAARASANLIELLGRISQVQGEASIAIGIIDIPVDERDAAFPIYKSQAEFAMGNTASAWDLYNQHAQQLDPIARQLTVPYCLWVLERDIEAQESDRAEALIRTLTIWSREAAGTFTPDQEAELKIAYADAAFQKGKLQTAKAWYRRVADAQEYRGTWLQHKALLRSVDVDRASRDFSGAMAELDRLMLIRDEDLRLRVHYARAEVLFDQENYADAFAEVSTVLKRDPSHADALILLGKSQLEMRKLVDASEIELGVTRDQKLIVPGEVIKINLSDPALNISGIGADIEIEIWTQSGDRERVMLHQLGDDKTKFRAEIPTALAARQPGDKVLQVLGRDEIRYGYSTRFREKMTDLPPDPDVVITVASDARLVASAGAFPPREGERRLNLEELGISTAQQALGTRRVRPGNPVYLRVTDPDQSKTDEIDQIIVAIETSNGDTIPRLVMNETGPHTGEFEATIDTARAQALAFASESAPGRDPNMVISGRDYPGWSGEVGSKATQQHFIVDLNDNVALGAMTMTCQDPTQAMTHFVVQTSMNGVDWQTRARYPQDPAPWDGRPTFDSFHTRVGGALLSALEGRGLPADWLEKMETTSSREKCLHTAAYVPNLSAEHFAIQRVGHPNSGMLVRFRAFFYQPAAAIRTFRLTGFPPAGHAQDEHGQTVFVIDGKPADEDADDPFTIVRELGPGLHEIQVWHTDQRGELEKRKPQLLCDADGQDTLVACPDSMFDPQTFPQATRDLIAGPTTITSSGDSPGQFDIAFGQNTRGRLVRLAIVGHEGTAPAIHKITLTDREGEQRLPVKVDYQQLRANETLEVVPGDTVSVRYTDDRVVSPRRTIQQARLSVAFNSATISATFIKSVQTDDGLEYLIEPIRRFKLDDSIGIVINDPDMDQSPEHDTVWFTVKASSGAEVRLEARETGPHTGAFMGRVFPVATKPKRDSEIQVPEGGTLTASYRDQENLDPGIPTDRTVTLEHARYTTPTLAVYDTTSQLLPVPEPDENADANSDEQSERGPEIVRPRRTLDYAYIPAGAEGNQSPRVVIGSALRFDVLAAHLAFADSSEIAAYVQTDSGRKIHKPTNAVAAAMPFDITVPGTLKLTAQPSRNTALTAPAGYVLGSDALPPTSRPALDEGRFAFSVPIALDDVPSRSFGTPDADELPSSMVPDALAVRPGDQIHIGFTYKDKQGKRRWLLAKATLDSHAFLDVMNGRYRTDISTAYVGEKLYVRLIAPHLDLGPSIDETTVQLKAASGATVRYALRESEAHSGVFKGSFALSYASQPAAGALPSVALHGLPVKYGDQVTVSYPETGADAPPARLIAVNKGADGLIEPFSKRYGEEGVAVQTTFTLAECFFELAKHHRKMDQESLARREMSHAQKLLAEAIESHRDEEMQAHAEYLLGNLAQEYADLSKNEESKKLMYQDALARFSRIPLDYPDTEFAPKAQFKKALVYEKLGEVDIAVEEYVKLAYKYPDHELIPSVMSRLGSYFQAQGLANKTQAEALEKRAGDTDAQGEAIRLRELAAKEYLNAAQVFKKLQERFPTDPLAGLAGLRSAQNYMRAGDYDAAIQGFQKVVETEQYDGKTIRSQALFWQGISYERLEETREAYEIYRRITFDFPDSVWAKQSRGRLADPVFARIIQIEEEHREQMLEALRNQ